MTSDAKAPTNWFARGGRAYARFRPEYPPELAGFLAAISPSRDRAADVGCGNGQLTVQLAAHFGEVVGLDPSEEQIAHAPVREGVRYLRASAESLPLPDRSVSLITAAQAAHWFDLPAFYAEARRIAVDGAVIALVTYGVLRLPERLHDRFSRFYRDEVGLYWPQERKLVDAGYRDMDFPFAERDAPELAIEREWEVGDFLGYISTWSAARRLFDAGGDAVLGAFARDISELWGEPTTRHAVSWPIRMRVGIL